MVPEVGAWLDIVKFDVSLQDVTDFIGLAPTISGVAGERWGPEGRLRRKQSLWGFSVPKENTYHAEEVLKRLLEIIEPYREKICRVEERFGVRPLICIAVVMEDSAPDVFLSKEVMERVVRLGADFELDLTVCAPEEESHPRDDWENGGAHP